jgi:hypothetical protein
MKSTIITAAIMTTMVGAFSACARDHNALNGTWTLVPAKSDFAGQPVVQTGTVTINDETGVIVISRSFVYEGAKEVYFYNDSTGSEHNNSTVHLGNLKTKARWDHGALKVTTTQSGVVTTEDYSLGSDGIMLVSVAKPDHRLIMLVFRRQ